WPGRHDRRAGPRPDHLAGVHRPTVGRGLHSVARSGTGRDALRSGARAPPLPRGPNGKNIAHVRLDRDRDFAMVLPTKLGGAEAESALFELAPKLYAKYARAAPKRDR